MSKFNEIGKLTDAERETVKKYKRMKLKRKARMGMHISKALIFFSIGLCVGIHWRVIKAMIKGTEMPELPEGHFHCPLYK